MGSVVETAATPLAGFETGFTICGIIMVLCGAVGMARLNPQREVARWAHEIECKTSRQASRAAR